MPDAYIYLGYHTIFCIGYPRISQLRPFRVSILHLCMILYKYLLYIVRGGVQIPALQVREGSKYLLYSVRGSRPPGLAATPTLFSAVREGSGRGGFQTPSWSS